MLNLADASSCIQVFMFTALSLWYVAYQVTRVPIRAIVLEQISSNTLKVYRDSFYILLLLAQDSRLHAKHSRLLALAYFAFLYDRITAHITSEALKMSRMHDLYSAQDFHSIL